MGKTVCSTGIAGDPKNWGHKNKKGEKKVGIREVKKVLGELVKR